MNFKKLNLRILFIGLFLILILSFFNLFFSTIKGFLDDGHSYKIDEKIEWLNPKTNNIKIQGQNYIYTSADNTQQFEYPRNWKVKRCASGCDISSSYAFYPENSNESVINIHIFTPGSYCNTETQRLMGVKYWEQVDVKKYTENGMPVTIFEGIVEDSDKMGYIYQQSMKYIQSKDKCYEILSHSKNNPSLFKQSKMVRDSIHILK